VLVLSATWGAWLGIATSVVCAGAYNFFQLPPTGRFTLASSDNWVALVAFVIAATLASAVADVTRARAGEANARRREADLAAEMARTLLRGDNLAGALHTAAARLAATLGLTSAAIELEPLDGDVRRVAFALRDGTRRLGTLLVPADTPEDSLRRLQDRVVPALEALLSAALEREELISGAVETAALRRADVVKTALLRAVSHDLRSPLTAISAAGDAIASPALEPGELEELASIVRSESQRLSRLVDNLLDLSRLEAGVAEPRRDWIALDEVIAAALRELHATDAQVTLSLDPELPLLRADAAQLERAFVNVLENALRYSGTHAVLVRARAVRGRVIVRVVDRGPGIPPAQLERVFEPFYRAGAARGEQRGSGLGLAIARGFSEANGGTLRVESLPGQGATFVFELPLQDADVDGPPPAVPAGGDQGAAPQ
jgi:two-component system sensor histidine kinase KdpD